MSTILDSLKKSSDQRNNSEGSSLDKFNFGNGKESSSASKIILVLFIALLLAGSFWVYQSYFASESSDFTQNESTKPLAKKTNEETAQINAIKSEPLAATKNKKEKPDSEAIKAQIKKLKERKEQAKREARLSDLNRNNSSFVNKNEEDIDEKIKSQRALNKKQHKKQTAKMDRIKSRKNPKDKKQQPIRKHQTQKVVAQKPKTPAKQYRFLYQLPFSIRKEIPEIKLNIHVYDEQPENRIAIINGTRFAINDMITDQVLLKDILVNGILLDFNGTEFFIPN